MRKVIWSLVGIGEPLDSWNSDFSAIGTTIANHSLILPLGKITNLAKNQVGPTYFNREFKAEFAGFYQN